MGESVAEGTIVRWLKKVGDAVERDEPLFEISTDKVDAEIPSPAAGVLSEVNVKEGETVAINTVVAVIDETAREARVPSAGKPRRAKPATAAANALRQAPAHQRQSRNGVSSAQGDGDTRSVSVPTLPSHLRVHRAPTAPTTHPVHPPHLLHGARLRRAPAGTRSGEAMVGRRGA